MMNRAEIITSYIIKKQNRLFLIRQDDIKFSINLSWESWNRKFRPY